MISFRPFSPVFLASRAMRSAVCLVCVCGATTAGVAHASIGEVSLTIGKGWITSADGSQAGVLRGQKLEAGDQIETADGGHVHVRFVDGAYVSVRPSTRLVIESYQFDPLQPAQSTVRFRLEKGIARSISGAAAENARERFRLNTPLVAIGVRGTDFVVRSVPDQTLASVNQGAIVMAPLGEGCVASGLGACGTTAARLLSADMGSLVVEYRPDLVQPEVKSFNGSRVLLAGVSTAGPLSPKIGPEQGQLTSMVVARAGSSGADEARGDPSVVATVLSAAKVAAEPEAPRPVLPVPPLPVVEAPIPVQPSEPLPILPAVLAWGRWAGAADGTDFAVTPEEARNGRVVTVGNSQYFLYRAQAADAVLATGLGSYDFSLQQAHAHLNTSNGQVLPATVQDGTLQIDFAGRRFATSLNVFSSPSGTVNIGAAGTVRDDGMFTSRSATQNLAGATSLDGKSAGYTFEKFISTGTLSGITLWSR